MCCCSLSRSTVAHRAEEQLLADHPKPHTLGEAGRQYMLTTGDPVRHGTALSASSWRELVARPRSPEQSEQPKVRRRSPRCGRYRCKEQLVEAVVGGRGSGYRLLSKYILGCFCTCSAPLLYTSLAAIARYTAMAAGGGACEMLYPGKKRAMM